MNTSKLPTFAEETRATLKLGRCFLLIKPGSLQPPRNGLGTAEDFTSSQMDDVILSGALRQCMFCVCDMWKFGSDDDPMIMMIMTV